MNKTSKAGKVLVLVSSIALAGGCIAYASWRTSVPAQPTVEEEVYFGGSKSMPMPIQLPKPPKQQGP